MNDYKGYVTILILIDWPLQFNDWSTWMRRHISHNPYFNRLTFAMWKQGEIFMETYDGSQSLF